MPMGRINYVGLSVNHYAQVSYDDYRKYAVPRYRFKDA